jgi:nitroimidazol reductase NimA-like FMN-containing flavoprotein (pyridoxamine 5'-phosphate oxidase superfamily)
MHMAGNETLGELDSRYSSEDATATSWAEASDRLAKAEIYWLTTVRPDGRPHVTPLIAIWADGVLSFCTGEHERKAKNLANNLHCAITTGCNSYNEGLDLVIEGDAVRVTDESALHHLAEAYRRKYDWHFTVRDGSLTGDGGNVAQVYDVRAATVFGFGKGTFSQTRWLF